MEYDQKLITHSTVVDIPRRPAAFIPTCIHPNLLAPEAAGTQLPTNEQAVAHNMSYDHICSVESHRLSVGCWWDICLFKIFVFISFEGREGMTLFYWQSELNFSKISIIIGPYNISSIVTFRSIPNIGSHNLLLAPRISSTMGMVVTE